MLSYADLSGNGKGVGFTDRVEAINIFDAAAAGNAARMFGTYNVSISGTFVGEFVVERSIDNGKTWGRLTALGELWSFTAPCEETFSEPQPGVLVRLRSTAWTSGVAVGRVGQ